MSKPTVFITGVTGNIGQSTLSNLDKNKLNIKVGVRSLEKGQKFIDQGYSIEEIDFDKKETLLKAFKGVDTLFIVPPSSESRGQQGANAIHAAKEAGVKHVVLFSVVNASEEKRILFQRQFAVFEEAAKTSGLGWTILQAPFFQENVFGNERRCLFTIQRWCYHFYFYL